MWQILRTAKDAIVGCYQWCRKSKTQKPSDTELSTLPSQETHTSAAVNPSEHLKRRPRKKAPILQVEAAATSAPLPATPSPSLPPTAFQRFKSWAGWAKDKAVGGLKWVKDKIVGGVAWTANHFLFPLFAPFRLVFLLSQIILSVFVQFSLTAIEQLAAAIIIVALLGLTLIDGIIGIIRSFRGEKIYHNNVFNEFTGLITNVLLLLLIFSRHLFPLGWVVGLILSILNTFGPESNRSKMHLHTLPFLQTSDARTKYQLFAAFQRGLHVFIVLFSNVVSKRRLASFLIEHIKDAGYEAAAGSWFSGLLWSGSLLWALLFTVVAVAVVRLVQTNRSFLNLGESKLFKLSTALIFMNTFLVSTWEYFISTAQSYGAIQFFRRNYGGCSPTDCTDFNLGNNLSTILTLLLTGSGALISGIAAIFDYRTNVGETQTQEIPPPARPVTGADMKRAREVADSMPTGFFKAPRLSKTADSSHFDAPRRTV